MVEVTVGDVVIGGGRPLVLLAGLNVLEPDLDVALRVADRVAKIAASLGLRWVFKASWDKANRTSHRSYRGPGLDEGLRQLATVRARFDVPILTDVHEPHQAAVVASVADMLQVPAFLVRQTDLLAACAATGKPLHLKRMPALDPAQLGFAVEKCRHFGQRQVVLCERGGHVGPGPLVLDPTGLHALRTHGVPVSLDVTHSLQVAGGGSATTPGRAHLAEVVMRAGVAVGIDALFIETHPDPSHALCDGPSATALRDLPQLLERARDLDRLVKGWSVSDPG